MVDIRVDMTLDYPVSIESILSVSFSQENFKLVFKFILDALRRHELNFKSLKDSPNKSDFEQLQRSFEDFRSRLSQLEDTSNSHSSSLKTHTEDLKKQKSHQEKQEQSIEALQKSQDSQEKALISLESLTSSHSRTIDSHKDSLDSHTTELQSLRKLISGLNSGTGSGVPVELLSDLEKKIQRCDEKHSKAEEGLNTRVTDLENAVKNMQEIIKRFSEELQKIKQSLSALDEKINEKADKSVIDRLKSLASAPQGGGISDLVLEDLRKDIEIIKKKLLELPGLSQSVENLQRRVVVIEDKLKSKIDRDEVLGLLSGLSGKEQKDLKDPNIPFILKKLTEHDEKIEAILKILGQPTASSDAELWMLYKELKSLLDGKASLADLKALEERLLEKVIAVCETMGNRFADRADTLKSLKYLESFIKEFLEFGLKRPGAEDAMFTKKPLGGFSCASCETNLEKLKGIAAAYYSWNKMPYRDPNDRIARAGPGFSKMLATMHPDVLNNRMKTGHKTQVNLEEDVPEQRPPTAGKKIVRPMSAYHH